MATVKKVPAKKTAARKAAAKKAPSSKVAARKVPAKKVPAKKAPAKKAPARKPVAPRTGAATLTSSPPPLVTIVDQKGVLMVQDPDRGLIPLSDWLPAYDQARFTLEFATDSKGVRNRELLAALRALVDAALFLRLKGKGESVGGGGGGGGGGTGGG